MATVLHDPAFPPIVHGRERTQADWRPLLQVRTWVAIVIWLLGTDLAIYRGGGWAGWALVFVLVPTIVAIGPRKQSLHKLSWIFICALLGLLSIKLVWGGTIEAVAAASFIALAATVAGQGIVPYVGQLFLVPFRMMIGAITAFVDTFQVAINHSDPLHTRTKRPSISGQTSVGLALPILAVVIFSGIFVLANPNFRGWFDEQWQWLGSTLTAWIENIDGRELIFWLFSGTLGLALLCPYVVDLLQPPPLRESTDDPLQATRASFFYPAARNTLIAVVILFAAYLGYEFYSMWFRTFPKGFYYAGYAHEGAFWLTVALALATFILSTIFCQIMYLDSRTNRLKWMAWLWSAENLLLAAAVYNRLLIYIDFNGLTRMRVIGLLGVTAVVIGFGLVVFKIVKQRRFRWLIQRQLWALALSLIAYAALPVDWLVHSYNSSQVLSGDLAPSVQMIAHNTRADGMLQILRLIDCEDVEIREGVRAMAAEWSKNLENRAPTTYPWTQYRAISSSEQRNQQSNHWSRFQLSEQLLQQDLDEQSSKFAEYIDENLRDQRLKRFYDYAYQWY